MVLLEQKRDARMSGAIILENQQQGEDAQRSGQDIRQGDALKPMVDPHIGTNV